MSEQPNFFVNSLYILRFQLLRAAGASYQSDNRFRKEDVIFAKDAISRGLFILKAFPWVINIHDYRKGGCYSAEEEALRLGIQATPDEVEEVEDIHSFHQEDRDKTAREERKLLKRKNRREGTALKSRGHASRPFEGLDLAGIAIEDDLLPERLEAIERKKEATEQQDRRIGPITVARRSSKGAWIKRTRISFCSDYSRCSSWSRPMVPVNSGDCIQPWFPLLRLSTRRLLGICDFINQRTSNRAWFYGMSCT